MHLFDSASKTTQAISKQTVNIYLCGPTVYDDAHLGHARSAVAFDLLRRVLLASGREVKFVRNYTDIDDKLINKSAQSGQSVAEIAAKYIARYEEDMAALSILPPDVAPKATEYVGQMVAFIADLLERKFAYAAADGIYLDAAADEKYLSLSRKDLSCAQSRLEGLQAKKNEHDFVLWKFAAGYYDAPFGAGRPGWHTECVCMILDIFKGGVDIHAGGADLFFPHHENEACQCRLSRGSELAQIWAHNGFVRVNNEKMSKSLGNSFFVRDALANAHAEALRLYLCSVHYRADFNYSLDDLFACKARLDRLYRLMAAAGAKAARFELANDLAASKSSALLAALLEVLRDDLNISAALAIFDEWLANAAKKLPAPADFAADLAAVRLIFGVGTDENYFALPEHLKELVSSKIAERAAAKAAKNYALADAIRDELAALGIAIKDGAKGCEIEYLGVLASKKPGK